MANSSINQYISDQLSNIIGDIPGLFLPNELAYISLQQKNERQIRDKIAFELQNRLDGYALGEYLVRCEWPSYVDEEKLNYEQAKSCVKEISGRTAVDMAILRMNGTRDDFDEVVALVEFKAHCFLNYEKWPYEEFSNDVAKMCSMTSIGDKEHSVRNADLYFIMLTSSIGNDCAKRSEYSSAVAYQDIFEKNLNKRHSQKRPTLYDEKNSKGFKDQIIKFWDGFMRLSFDFGEDKYKVTTPYIIQYVDAEKSNMKTPEPVIMSSGESFGYHLFQTGLVWGPYKASDLKVSINPNW